METTESTTTENVKEIPAKIAAAADQLLDGMIERQEKFAETVAKVRSRNQRITDQFIDAMMASQRDALTLGKKIAAEPTEFGKNTEAFVETLTSGQERTLEMVKAVYREQTDYASELRAAAEKMMEGTKSLTKPFEKMAANWMPTSK